MTSVGVLHLHIAEARHDDARHDDDDFVHHHNDVAHRDADEHDIYDDIYDALAASGGGDATPGLFRVSEGVPFISVRNMQLCASAVAIVFVPGRRPMQLPVVAEAGGAA